MSRIYTYKGFEIAVELERVWEMSGNVSLLPPRGYIAVVHIRTTAQLALRLRRYA